MDRLDLLGSETGYLSLGRHAECGKRLSANVVGAKAKMSEKVFVTSFDWWRTESLVRETGLAGAVARASTLIFSSM